MSARFGSEGLGAWVQDRLGAAGRAPRRRGEPSEVDVRTGPTVPAVAVRAALALAGAGAVLVALAAPGPAVPPVLLVLLVLVGVAPAAAPRLPLAAVLLLVVGLRLLAGSPPPLLLLAALVLLLHVVLRLAPVAARTGWRTRIEVAVLRDDLPAALAAQVGAQVLAGVAVLTAGGADSGTGWRVVGLLGVVVLAALAIARPVQAWWRADP